jgi:ketosteroid isomerase-like protein
MPGIDRHPIIDLMITTRTSIMAGPEQVARVVAMYEAFGSGDLAASLDLVTDDVDWGTGVDPAVPSASLVPNFAHFEGRDGAIAYFTHVADTVEIHRFAPVWITTSEDEVVALIDLELTVKSTGRRLSLEEVHRFRFNADGQIDRYRLHVDNATVLAAASR